jgi:hypothetical protein
VPENIRATTQKQPTFLHPGIAFSIGVFSFSLFHPRMMIYLSSRCFLPHLLPFLVAASRCRFWLPFDGAESACATMVMARCDFWRWPTVAIAKFAARLQGRNGVFPLFCLKGRCQKRHKSK